MGFVEQSLCYPLSLRSLRSTPASTHGLEQGAKQAQLAARRPTSRRSVIALLSLDYFTSPRCFFMASMVLSQKPGYSGSSSRFTCRKNVFAAFLVTFSLEIQSMNTH
jgi:hypothetical protein